MNNLWKLFIKGAAGRLPIKNGTSSCGPTTHVVSPTCGLKPGKLISSLFVDEDWLRHRRQKALLNSETTDSTRSLTPAMFSLFHQIVCFCTPQQIIIFTPNGLFEKSKKQFRQTRDMNIGSYGATLTNERDPLSIQYELRHLV